MIVFVTGGARSGKSSFAENFVSNHLREKKANDFNVLYLATATAGDKEMTERIVSHKARRPKDWQLIEEPKQLSAIVNQYNKPSQVILIDCLTLWLSNWLCDSFSQVEGDKASDYKDKNSSSINSWESEKKLFIEALTKTNALIVIVSNEVGSGIVPMGELSRTFVDQSGWLNQTIAKTADKVVWVVSGIPVVIKPQVSNED